MLQIEVITDISTEPITLQEAKNFLAIDYSDYDTLITNLITASREVVETNTGKASGTKLIQITDNSYSDRTGEIVKIYPITPFISNEDWSGENGNITYQYSAGYSECPQWFKFCILQRVATGFAYRENGITESINQAINASILTERKYVTQLAV